MTRSNSTNRLFSERLARRGLKPVASLDDCFTIRLPSAVWGVLLKRTFSISGVLLAACLSFVATCPALAAFDQDDAGLAAMASRAVQSIEDVPFAGGYDDLNGYGWPKTRAFQVGYSAALRQGIPEDYLSNRPWMKTFDGPTSPNELVRFRGTTVFFKNFCQAHNCGGNEVYVLYDVKTHKVWGASTTFSPTGKNENGGTLPFFVWNSSIPCQRDCWNKQCNLTQTTHR